MSLSKTSALFRARFHNLRVRAEAPGKIRVNCAIENSGGSAWSDSSGSASDASGPVSLGYRVFDAITGLPVLEGERIPVRGECPPGQRREVEVEIQLPPEEGNYAVWISLVQERGAWFHDLGSDFVLVEVDSSPGKIVVRNACQTTVSFLRARHAMQQLWRGLSYPWRTISRHHTLMFSMVRRDILGRYRGSMAGAFWTLINPLLLMLVYYFVFGIVLRASFGPGQGSGGYVFYFLCGMLPWLAFSEALGRSAGVVFEHSNFVKRIVFPLEILPVNLTLMGLTTEFFGLIIFLIALVTLGPGLHWTAAYFPVILLPQILFTAGLCWFLAALGVFLRDTGQIMGFVLTVWFFVTPICYSAASLPQKWLWAFEKNPMYTIVASYRAILLEGAAPAWPPLLKLWILSLCAFWIGYAWFYKAKKSFADLI